MPTLENICLGAFKRTIDDTIDKNHYEERMFGEVLCLPCERLERSPISKVYNTSR